LQSHAINRAATLQSISTSLLLFIYLFIDRASTFNVTSQSDNKAQTNEH